jgi:hypothetical protein
MIGDTEVTGSLEVVGTFTVNGEPISDGTGDVVGPVSGTDLAVARFDGTTGKLLQDSPVTITDTTGVIATPGGLEIAERADHANAPAAGKGQLWVKNDTPSALIYTDDAGTDHPLGGSGITQLIGDITAGPGSGSQAATIANGAVDIAHLSATGTPDNTKYLRGDNTWATPAGSGTVTSVAVSGSDGIEVDSGSPITTNGTIALGINAGTLRSHINVEDGATADQSNAEIETAYNAQVAVVEQSEAEAGVATTVRRWTAQRVAQAIAALAPGVSLSGTPDYITISGQTITRALINLASHVTGRLPWANVAQMAAATIAGRASGAGTGDVTELSAAQVRTIINVADGADVSPVTLSNTVTLTNKRLSPRTGTTASSATPTINTDNVDHYEITAQTTDITSMTTNLSGTPTDREVLTISITGTASRAITWGSGFENGAAALPSTTDGTKRLDTIFWWNATTSKWRCMAAGSTA